MAAMATGSAFAMQGMLAAGSAYNQSQATKSQGDYENRIAQMNARRAEAEADDAVKRGETAATRRQQDINRTKGAQRAALAAGGVDVDSEAAQNIAAETEAIGAADVAAIRTNAWRAAWGLKSEAEDTRSRGQMAKTSSKYAARQTMLTGALQGASYGARSYAEFKK